MTRRNLNLKSILKDKYSYNCSILHSNLLSERSMLPFYLLWCSESSLVRKAHVNWIAFENTLHSFSLAWYLKVIMIDVTKSITWCIALCTNSDKFSGILHSIILPGRFSIPILNICYVLTVTKRQMLHIYSHVCLFISEKCPVCQNTRHTRCSAVGCTGSFHTLEDSLKQMYLPNHKPLLSNFIVLDEWTVKWNPVAWFCRKPELIILNSPCNKQMLW